MDESYLVRRIEMSTSALNDWDHPRWLKAEVAEVAHFHPKSSDHRPRTRVRLLHDGRHVLARFDVEDRYVISRATAFGESVCVDSCVEWFFGPKGGCGYFNLEVNCGGTALMSYIEDPTRTETGFVKYEPVSAGQARELAIYHSMPPVVQPERTEPTTWRIAYRLPLDLLEQFVGAMGDPGGQTWQGNFYKCADHSSHPHWASWAPMGDALNFHMPEYFRPIRFE